MKEYAQMSESEQEVMQLIWNHDGPITSARVIEILSETKSWKPSTVWTFLGRLVDKGLVHAEKVGKRSLYTPRLTEQEYRKAQTRQFLNSVHQGSIKNFFAALGGNGKLNREELEELRQWLEQEAGEPK